jgi:alkanesulfonate monooxygenase SsuD/methylene tetrahydromethanopterin reductase-like flavin-dependent oxidoreductase (luciferase family)
MKYGVYLPIFGPYGDARTLATLARDAEQAGWDGFFIWDHLASRDIPTDVVDPWVALAAAAVVTDRILLGPLVTPLPRRRPWKVARETVSLDHLSGGRFVFGVGIGSSRPSEWGEMGEETDEKVRGAMLDEGLAVLAGLWSGEPFSHDGPHYHVENAHFLPRAIQQPRVPVWVAGYWPNKPPFRRAARWDGAFPLMRADSLGVADMDTMADCIAFIQAERARLGLSGPFDIVHRGRSLSRTDTANVAAVAGVGVTWWLEHMVPMMYGGTWAEPWPVEGMHARILDGPPRID